MSDTTNTNTNTSTQPTSMTPAAARRIQSHSDKTGSNQGFKSRAMGAAAKNANSQPKK